MVQLLAFCHQTNELYIDQELASREHECLLSLINMRERDEGVAKTHIPVL